MGVHVRPASMNHRHHHHCQSITANNYHCPSAHPSFNDDHYNCQFDHHHHSHHLHNYQRHNLFHYNNHDQISSLKQRCREDEVKAEMAEREVQKLQKEVDKLEAQVLSEKTKLKQMDDDMEGILSSI